MTTVSEEQPKTRNKWTSAELKELRRMFPISSLEDLVSTFPRHSLRSIRTAGYELGLKRPPCGSRKWADVVRNHVPVFGFGRVVYD